MDTLERIRQLLNERNWTEYRLEKESGLSDSTIKNNYKRNTQPTIDTLEAICRGFGITLAQFFAEGDMVELTPEQKELIALVEDFAKNEVAPISKEYDLSGEFPIEVFRMAAEIKKERCPGLEFFVHEGSCDGENRKLYPIRIRKQHIPDELTPVFLDYADLLTEGRCCEILHEDFSHPSFPIGDTITLNISNEYNVYYNFTHLCRPWIIGNLKTEKPEDLVRKIVSGDTLALRAAKKCVWAELADQFGDSSSDRVFSLEDYKMFLFNRYLEQ